MRAVLTYRLPDTAKVTLRPARPDDAAAIITAVRSSAQDRSYVLMEVYGKDAATQRAYIERLDREHNLFLVATVNEQIVGILALLDFLVCSTPEPCLSVGVHIIRDWRGRGIGSAMLRYALRWGKEHGYHRLEADIFTTNERSVHLFDKAGFREVTCRRRSVQVGVQQISEVILARTLG
ncbi:MAG: GNAT family N-acetyltransferase [Candidatus Methylomirabilia bacterium]